MKINIDIDMKMNVDIDMDVDMDMTGNWLQKSDLDQIDRFRVLKSGQNICRFIASNLRKANDSLLNQLIFDDPP